MLLKVNVVEVSDHTDAAETLLYCVQFVATSLPSDTLAFQNGARTLLKVGNNFSTRLYVKETTAQIVAQEAGYAAI